MMACPSGSAGAHRAILPVPPLKQLRPWSSGAHRIGRAAERVENARILALAAKPIQLGIQPFRITPLEIGDSADSKRAQIPGEAGPDARQRLELVFLPGLGRHVISDALRPMA